MSIRHGIGSLALRSLTALSLCVAVATPANAISDGAARLQAQRAQAEDRGEVAEAPGGSLPGAVVWVALGLGIALMIVVIGLSDAETVSE